MASRTKSNKRLIYLILLLALALRLINIDQSLWLDEAIGAIAVKQFSYSEIVTKFMMADNHPPLYYLLLKIWSDIWGYSEIGLRSLSIFLSFIAIYFTYKIAYIITKSEHTSLFAALFLSVSQFFVYFSQEARMYAPAAAFSTACIYFYLKSFDNNASIKTWIYFSISLAGLFFIDYVPVFMYPIFLIYPFILRSKIDKKWIRNFLLSHLILLITGLLWLPYFAKQLEGGRFLMTKFSQWLSVAGGANIKNATLLIIKFTSGRITFLPKIYYYLYAVLSGLPLILLLIKSLSLYKNKKIVLIYLWLFSPIIFGFLVSFFFPAFNYFRFTFVYPSLAILISIGLSKIKNYKFWAFVIIFLQSVSLFIYYADVNQQREQWKEAIAWINSDAKNENAILLFEFSEPFAPYQWYETGEVESAGATNSISADPKLTRDKTRKLIKNKNIIYHFDYLRDLSDPQRIVEDELIKNGFKIKSEHANFVGVGKITKWQLSQ